MTRQLSNESSLDNLKREAKRWLRALRDDATNARERLLRAVPSINAIPTLRDVQHALAREHGFDGWIALSAEVERIANERKSARASGATLALDPDVSRLLLAASKGEVGDARAILDARPDIINVRATLPGHTGERAALHHAVGAPNGLEMMRLLLSRGADPNVRDEGDNAFALHFVAERRDLDMARLLLEYDADTDGAGDDHELGVMGWATVFGNDNYELARELLQHGAAHTLPSAVVMGDVVAIERLVAANPEQLSMKLDRTNRHRTLLHLAVIKKQPASMNALLRLGIDANGVDVAGLTALDQAAIDGNTDLVDRLMSAGVAMELPAAISLARSDEIERILRADSQLLKPGHKYGQLIVQSSERGSADTIRRLLQHGADVNARATEDASIDETSGYTALHAAAFHGNMEVVEVLLQAGANPRAREERFCSTPAGWANHGNHDAVAQRILREDIDILDAAAFNMPDRIRSIVARDPGSLRRPLGAYVRCERSVQYPWKNPDQRPLDAARMWGSKDAETVILELLDQSDRAHRDVVNRFLLNAAPDWRTTTGSDIRTKPNTALRLLQQHPEIAGENIYTAVVCGSVERVRELLNDDAALANSADADRQWTPLLMLSTSRLATREAQQNATEIARLLLDNGADPNAYCPGGEEVIGYDEGDIHFTVLTNVIGRGEGRVPPHARVRELATLLLERGAEPYDKQMLYNVAADHSSRSDLNSNDVWLFDLIYQNSLRLGRGDDWKDPLWRMLDVGSYGPGANFLLQAAVVGDNVELAEWMLKHGADPNVRSDNPRFAQYTPAQEADLRGRTALRDLMSHFSEDAKKTSFSAYENFARSVFRGNAELARAAIAQHPEWLTFPLTLILATRSDNADAVRLLLELGMSPDINENSSHTKALHSAAMRGATRSAQVLIDAGADVDARELHYGATPMGAATWAQQRAMTDLLAPYSKDLFNLVFAGKVDRVREVLKENPALAKGIERSGETMLMRLPDSEDDAIVLAKLLLENGADPALRTSDGRTAADIAEQRALLRVAGLLRQ